MAERMRRPRRLVTASRASVVTLVAALVMSSCGLSSSSSPPTPEGFTRTSMERVSFAYPSGWRSLEELRDPSDEWVPIVGHVVDNTTMAQINVNQSMPSLRKAETAAWMAIMGVRFGYKDFRTLKERPVQVEGAARAYRFDYTFTKKVQGSGEGTIRAVDVSTIDADGRTAVIRISGVNGDLKHAEIQRIVDTIAVEGEGLLPW